MKTGGLPLPPLRDFRANVPNVRSNGDIYVASKRSDRTGLARERARAGHPDLINFAANPVVHPAAWTTNDAL
jgi:hypothetical protein